MLVRPSVAMTRLVAALVAALAVCVVAPSGRAESAATPAATHSTPRIIVVDKEAVLRESDVARRLAGQEQRARAELQERLSALTAEIEREESELTALREQLAKDEFDERVRQFTDKVQAARRSFQQESEALQRRFIRSRQTVAEALVPVLRAILAETGADIVVDSRSVLAVRAGADHSREAIARLNEATAALFPDAEQPKAAE